ncbi:ParB/RepB/Spo0J family partition protein [Jiella sonneratiae]|uniref:ParB/RepB/Spo0J family partition protein n=1 Tax=Jiella sonneratiae TaxID=2816856 RepID=A0ABS3J0S3_9HYPH|nr:ParB/RepB/Spo0J family partition protein [Jiella sonneratiae]MBO0903284.1 ParB/RepB/Spo0J family partition protein [Jiella sonneratiae]
MTEDRSRQRLGRGLASLIGAGAAGPSRPVPGFETQPAAPTIAAERSIPVGRITPNPHNPRRTFRREELDELAASIRQHGVVQPLLVRPVAGEPSRYELVAGERRLRAAILAGLAEVPVVTREINDRQSLEIAIIENVQRTDLNAIEEALGYQALIDEHGYTQADLAEILAKSRSHVANTLRLLKLPQEVRAMVENGSLSAGAARTAVTAEDPLSLARRIVAENLSVREAEALARDPAAIEEPALRGPVRGGRARRGRDTAPEDKSDAIIAYERRLREATGFEVTIELQAGRPVVSLVLDRESDLDGLIERLDQRGYAPAFAGPRLRSL